MFNHELGGKIMTEFFALRAKTYPYIIEDVSVHKRAKGTKKCIIKREIMFEHYKDCLFNSKTIIKSQQRFRSDHHRVYTKEVNKIALSSNDDKRIQTYDKVNTYPHGTNAFKICENEMRYVILKKIILKLLTLVKEKSRNKCIIKKESIFKNESQGLRNESQETFNNELQQTNESQTLTNESQQKLEIKCDHIKNMMSRIKKDYDDMQEKLYEPEMDEKKMRINKKIDESGK